MKRYKLILLLLFGSFMTAFAQETIPVTGTVSDEFNNLLAGVSVVIKNQVGGGAMTDLKGQYVIKTEPYSTLIFSHVGFASQEIKITNKSLLNVKLKTADSSVLTQVIVTAAGPQKKATVVGSVTSVNVNDLRMPTANITNALAGNVPGIIAMQGSGEPGGNQSEFWIRGISTFGANQSALVLVDGFERPFNEINIEDIQSFSVLKDASATALYGSRGANGVVLITTKKGKVGKVNVDGKVEYGYVTRTRTPKFVDGYTYALLANEAKTTRNLEPLYTANELEIFKNKLDPDLYPNIDWQDKMLNKSTNIYRAAINLSGGASIARYFVSLSYVDEGGMYKSDNSLKDYKTNANMTRWNYRMNYDLDVTKTTTVALGVSGFLEKQNFPGLNNQNIWYSLVGQSPVSIPFLYSNGLVPAYGTGNRTNPWVLATQTGYREHWQNKAESNITLNQRLDAITQGLRLTGRLAFDANSLNNINRMLWPEQYNVERRRDRNGNLVMHRISPEALMFQESNSEGERIYQGEVELGYGHTFSGKHTTEGMLKSFVREQRQTQNLGSDIKNGVPRRNLSLSGRAMYGYMNRYLVEFNFGYTGSETFKPGHQFGFFPAVALGWNVAEEKFVKDNVNWLDLFKIRYSNGKVGNDLGNVRFAYLSTLENGGSFNYGEPVSPNVYTGLYYSQVSSDQLTWEVARKQNLGFDISLLKNKFSLNFDIFQETRWNIFMQRGQLPATVGISSAPWANVGRMDNRGFDGNFAIQHKVRKVDFTLRGNLSYYKNKVLERDEQDNPYSYLMQKGHRIDQTRGLVALGLFKDYEDIRNSPRQTFGSYMPGDIKYKDVNGDGIINGEDVVAVGAGWRPSVQYGMGLSGRWKGLDVSVLFQGSGLSSYFLNGPTVYPFVDGGWGNILTEVVDPGNRWISNDLSGGHENTENPNAKYPRLSYGGNSNNYRASTFWLRDGSYLRFKHAEIGYSVPAKVASRLRLSNFRVYLLGNNLMVWDQVKVWDPEMASSDGTRYPLPKTVTLGLTCKF